MAGGIVAGAVVGGLLVLFVIFKLMWRVAEPNDALIIAGLREHTPSDAVSESLGFKIVTGKGTLVIPGVQTVRRLSLDLRQTELTIDCVTHQGIPLGIRGVVIYKVGDDFASIANAARRFLDQQAQMDQRVHNVFTGHLRAIVGNMTVEEMIRDREKLTALTRSSSGSEMEKLGLIVDSLQVQEIEDSSGYITNIGRPHAAAVERDARIAQALADQAATEAELEADADAQRVKLAAGAEAEHVRVDASARSEATRNIGQAEADAVQARGMAEGEAVRAKGMAEAEAIKARADALAENQDAVIGQQLAERWPEIVEAAAKPFGDIDQMIVLNGAQGLSETLAQALSQGVAGLQMARKVLAGASGTGNGNGSGNGSGKGAVDAAAEESSPATTAPRRRSTRKSTD